MGASCLFLVRNGSPIFLQKTPGSVMPKRPPVNFSGKERVNLRVWSLGFFFLLSKLHMWVCLQFRIYNIHFLVPQKTASRTLIIMEASHALFETNDASFSLYSKRAIALCFLYGWDKTIACQCLPHRYSITLLTIMEKLFPNQRVQSTNNITYLQNTVFPKVLLWLL